MSLDDDTLRAWIAAGDPSRPWPGRDAAHDARLEELACAAPALAAEVLALRAAVATFLAAHDAEQTDDCDSDDIYRALDDARMGLRRVLGGAPRYVTTSRPGAVIEVQERLLSAEEIASLDYGRKPFGSGR